MKWLDRAITELFFRPCWNLGHSGFWEVLVFGFQPDQIQDRLETPPHPGLSIVMSMHRKKNIRASELGIDLQSFQERELFRWFLACLLFGKPIQKRLCGEHFFSWTRLA
jgi:hypothetical protein